MKPSEKVTETVGKMNEKVKDSKGLKITIFFTIIVMLEIAVSVGLSFIFQLVLGIFDFSPTALVILGSILAGTVIAYFVNKLILKPIVDLNNAMKKVSKGDFSVRINKKSFIGEISDLFSSFDVMTKELGATELLQSDFVSNVSHEIKTPAGAIEGYATLLQDSDLSEEEKNEYLEKILFNTRRLSDLVSNILLLSKVSNQSIETKKTSFRLDEQIRQAIMLLEPKWMEKKIDFDVDLIRMDYFGNEGLLFHIWTNLIGNAIKFSPNGKSVSITLKKEDDFAVFSVSDEGNGIPEEAINHIFDKFYQGDSSHKSEGCGLGLALSKKITDLSGGRIYVENLKPNGCRFSVILPM